MLSLIRNTVLCCSKFSQVYNNSLNQQIRTTYILKRKFQPQLHKKNLKPKTLRSRHYVYEVVKDTTLEKKPPLKLILTSNVEGVGSRGEVVEVKPTFGYNNLILLQKAVYANEESIEKYAYLRNESEDKPSCPTIPLMMRSLAKMVLSVIMNKESPWTLQPWHIRTSFRKCGWEIPEKYIIIPETPISGPDMSIENKEFSVTIQFTPKEIQEVKCRIHHWSTDPSERLPFIKDFWKTPTEPILTETIKSTEQNIK